MAVGGSDDGHKRPYAVLLVALAAICLVLAPVKEAGAHASVSGTVWKSSSVITPSDSSVCTVSAADPPRKTVAMNENGPGNLGRLANAWIFKANCDGGANEFKIRVHPDFATQQDATTEAEKYGNAVGRLPKVLRSKIRNLSIHKASHSWFTTKVGGDIRIYTEFQEDKYDEEILVHEAAHVSLDDRVKSDSKWLAARKADGAYISSYAKTYATREDVAESFLAYFSARFVPKRIDPDWKEDILQTIPNRIAYFDALLSADDMKPFTAASGQTVAALPSVSVAAKAASATEGGNAVFTVSASTAPAADLEVTLAVADDATSDFLASGDEGKKTVTIAASQTSAELTVPTQDDSANEADGSVTATVQTGSGYTPSDTNGSASVAVSDDDDPTLSVTMAPASASEGDTGKTYATVTFGLDPVRGEATSFKACLKNTGTATQGASADYQFVNAGSDTPLTLTSDCHSYTLATNAASGTVRLLIRGDGDFEPDETVVVELKDPPAGVVVSGTAGTATHVILNDDAAPTACVPAALLEKVEGYYDHNKDRPSGYGANWFRVLVAFGARSPDGWTADNRTILPMPAADARARQANWFGWGPVADALECLEGTTPTEPEITIAGGTGITEGGDAVFTVSASPVPTANLTVSLTVADDASSDFLAAGDEGPQSVVIAAGQASAALTLTTVQDSDDEADGSVTASVASGTGYRVGSASTATVSVADDDVLPVVGIAGGAGVTEGGDAVFTLTATPPPQSDITVKVDVADSGDFASSGEAGERQVTIGTTGTATLDVATDNDTADESDGSITATVGAGSGYTPSGTNASASVAVSDDDEPTLSVTMSPASASEGDTGKTYATVTFGLDPVRGEATSFKACLKNTGTATRGSSDDYQFVNAGSDTPLTLSSDCHTYTLAANAASGTVRLLVRGDAEVEPDETVVVELKDPPAGVVVSGTAGTATHVILNDDAAPTACVPAALLEKVEQYYDHNKDKPPGYGANWFRVLVAFGARSPDGWTADNRTILPMPAADARAREANWFGWGPVADALECLEGITPTEPEITVTGGTGVTEGGDAVFTVSASSAPAANLTVSLAVADDGASDFLATSDEGTKTVTIVANQTSATLTFATEDDSTDEADGSVTATVSGGTGYTVGSPSTATVAVADNDPTPQATPVVSITGGNAITEGGTARFTLTASPAPQGGIPVDVNVEDSGTFASSGQSGSRQVTIGTTGTATLDVVTDGDATDEPDGSLTATVQTGTGYSPHDTGGSASVAVSDDDDPPPVPVVSVSAGAAVDEGGNAAFTITANPAPATGLTIAYTVAQSGDYLDAPGAGRRTVTLAAGATGAGVAVATVDDAADEADGSVSVTLASGTGYTLATGKGSATVTVHDNDEPVVSIAAGSGVTEGTDASFTVTANPAPAAPLDVALTIAQSGDFAASGETGSRTVTVPVTGSLDVEVPTVDEPDGSVSAALEAGTGYTVAAAPDNAATVAVSDNDAAASGPTFSVGDETANENVGMMYFTVRLDRAVQKTLKVTVTARESNPVSARYGEDFLWWWPDGSALTFWPGQTEKKMPVYVYNDNHDEDPETFEVALSRPTGGAAIGDGVAVGTIVNNDPMPAAWLARFGRTVAEQVLDGIAGRIAAPRSAGVEGTFAGQALGFQGSGPGPGLPVPASGSSPRPVPGSGVLEPRAAEEFGSLSGAGAHGSWPGEGPGRGAGDAFGDEGSGAAGSSYSMTLRDIMMGSSFTATGETDGSGGSLAFWGRAAHSRFDGREGSFSLDGEATTAMLGADYARSQWLVGMALMQSGGEGGYRDTETGSRTASQICTDAENGMDPQAREVLCDGAVREGDGEVEASLTAAVPYASLQASERLKLWGAFGHGTGEVTLKPAMGGSLTSDISWTMAAAGLRGDVIAPPAEGSGPALAVTSDALWARTSSEKTHELSRSDSDVTRLRLGLEGRWTLTLEGGGYFTPKLEAGMRHDGGDAETGFGVELGGGLAWSAPALGLSLDLSGRTLIAHGSDDLKDRGFAAAFAFDPDPSSERGPSLSLGQSFGGQATGGLDALFAVNPLEDRASQEAKSRWTAEAAWGFAAFGGRFTGSPHAGVGLSTGTRDYTLGYRVVPARDMPALDVSFGVAARRSEGEDDRADHAVSVEFGARW